VRELGSSLDDVQCWTRTGSDLEGNRKYCGNRLIGDGNIGVLLPMVRDDGQITRWLLPD